MNNLREIRESKGLSREKLEKVSRVPARAIKGYEMGQLALEKAQYKTILRLAHALGVDPDDLFDESLFMEIANNEVI